MDSALPLLLATLAGLALVIVLTALWQSLRVVLGGGGDARRVRTDLGPRARARQVLMQEKDNLLQAIRDVRFEHDLGKTSDGDLEQLDAQYRTRARVVLEELDAQLAPFRQEAAALVEGALGKAPVVSEKPVAPAVSAEAPAKPATSSCPGCSAPNDADAVFCKKCGARLAASEVAS
jgi:hypothetical protein